MNHQAGTIGNNMANEGNALWSDDQDSQRLKLDDSVVTTDSSTTTGDSNNPWERHTSGGASKSVSFRGTSSMEAPKCRTKSRPASKDIVARLSHMEEKICKAAKIELHYLNKAKELVKKKKEYNRLELLLSGESDSAFLPPRTASKLARLDESEKAKRLANLRKILPPCEAKQQAYLNHARRISQQRYRWTQMYKSLIKQTGVHRKIQLPPFLPRAAFSQGFSSSSSQSRQRCST